MLRQRIGGDSVVQSHWAWFPLLCPIFPCTPHPAPMLREEVFWEAHTARGEFRVVEV